MTPRAAIYGAVVALCVLIAGCGSTPHYPPPQGGNGQILVQLNGEPKQGAPKAKMGEVRDDYNIRRESIEQGKAFERVDYDALEDVVVIVSGGTTSLVSAPPAATELELDDDGFNRAQMLVVIRAGGKSASFTLHNQRKQAVHVYGFNERDGSFEGEISAGALGTVNVSQAGRYDVYCEEDDSLHCVLFVTDGDRAWIGNSDADAFFDDLPAGEYEVRVYPPRLPAWTKTVEVTAGKRETLTAELTVNNLPKVGE
ncbi:MAG: hypothetical protein H6841_00900 [Planctomycetes bacterium]|nr:hypothetical protein [Planctomycetota bacterium]MCB9935939.1 hypothetical protein [Planctomycetota bacterium]